MRELRAEQANHGGLRTRITVLRPAVPYLAMLALALVYALARDTHTFTFEWSQAYTEAPFLLYLFALLNAPLKERFYRPAIAALPLLLLYLVHDEFFVRWGDVPHLADVALFRDLFVAFTLAQAIGLSALLLAPFLFWAAMIDWRWRVPKKGTLLLPVPFVLVIGAIELAPKRSYEAINALTENADWSDRHNAELRGRLYSVLIREARKRSFAANIDAFTPVARSALRVSIEELAAIDHRNVHIVVMESFIDLRRLRGVWFSQPPFAPELSARVDPFISSSVSPSFGGETARAEFEVLCGVPSLRLYGVEFLGFSGAPTYCLPAILREAGYRTVLTFPYGPVFFNTRRAYPALGFDQRIFADRFSPPDVESVALGDQRYLFDGDLFPQNLKKVRGLLRERRPFLNYVMTMYGHWPFDIDRTRHTLDIQTAPPSEELRRIAVQMFYRTQALEVFIRELVAIDPRAIIVLVGDHLPPLPRGTRDYLEFGFSGELSARNETRELVTYENFLLVFVDGKPVKMPLMRHFDLPHFVLDQLSHGAHCRTHKCDFGALPIAPLEYLDTYQTIVGLAAEPAPWHEPGHAPPSQEPARRPSRSSAESWEQ